MRKPEVGDVVHFGGGGGQGYGVVAAIDDEGITVQSETETFRLKLRHLEPFYRFDGEGNKIEAAPAKDYYECVFNFYSAKLRNDPTGTIGDWIRRGQLWGVIVGMKTGEVDQEQFWIRQPHVMIGLDGGYIKKSDFDTFSILRGEADQEWLRQRIESTFKGATNA